MFAIENVVKDVSLSQSGCEVGEDGLVTIDSGASVNVCPKWFGKSTLQKSDGSVLLRGADGRTLQDHGKRQIWLNIGSNLKRCDFHVVEVTKPILSVATCANTESKRTSQENHSSSRCFCSNVRCSLRGVATSERTPAGDLRGRTRQPRWLRSRQPRAGYKCWASLFSSQI